MKLATTEFAILLLRVNGQFWPHVGEHDEGGQFTPVEGRAESICLILKDQGFWPVMSFITHTEARLLAHDLLEAVGK